MFEWIGRGAGTGTHTPEAPPGRAPIAVLNFRRFGGAVNRGRTFVIEDRRPRPVAGGAGAGPQAPRGLARDDGDPRPLVHRRGVRRRSLSLPDLRGRGGAGRTPARDV